MKVVGFVLFTLFYFGRADDPYVRITKTDPPVNDVEGQIIQRKTKDVQLTCTVENKPVDSEVQWAMQSGDNLEVQISTSTRSYDAYKWAIDQPTSTAWRLRIQNVEVSDEGIYTCKVSVSQQNYNVDSREVKVIELPQISDLITSNDMTKSAGDSATFECYASGRPTPLIKWSRLAGELMPNGGTEFIGNDLNIDVVHSDHAGVYKCTASNSAGYDEKLIRLTVSFRPEVTRALPVVRQKIGHPKVLKCSIKGYPMPNNINWLHNGVPVQTNSRVIIRNTEGAYNKISSALVFVQVREEDLGEYRCEAANDKGTGFASMSLVSHPTPTGNDGYQFAAASSLSLSVGTILMMLSACLLQRLHFGH